MWNDFTVVGDGAAEWFVLVSVMPMLMLSCGNVMFVLDDCEMNVMKRLLRSSMIVYNSLAFNMEPQLQDVGGRAILNVGEYGNENESGVNICDASSEESVISRCSIWVGARMGAGVGAMLSSFDVITDEMMLMRIW